MANPNPPISPGRPAGVPNKATTAARKAIGKFVDDNAQHLQKWLNMIAEGVPLKDKDGKILEGQFKVEPNPAKAFELFQSVVEYHVPKLQRSDIKVDGAIKVVKLASFADLEDEQPPPADEGETE